MGKNFLKKALVKSSNQLNTQERERREAREREVKEAAALDAKIAEMIQIPMLVTAVRQYEYLGKFTRDEMYNRIRSMYGEEYLKKVVDQVDELGPYTESDMTTAVLTMLSMKNAGMLR